MHKSAQLVVQKFSFRVPQTHDFRDTCDSAPRCRRLKPSANRERKTKRVSPGAPLPSGPAAASTRNPVLRVGSRQSGTESVWLRVPLASQQRSHEQRSDALHVLVGMAAWVVIALVWRRPLSDWRPWLAVLVLLGLNEFVDLWVERWPDPAMQYGESAKDLLLTMILPTLVMILVRSAPRLFSVSGGLAKRRRRGLGG